MAIWSRVLALSIGGMLGVNARYWLGLWVDRWAGPRFPWATFLINVSGSFAIGLLVETLARWAPHANARLLILTGFLGGYTTFSSFSLESLTLWERGQTGRSLAYVVGSVATCLVTVALGAGLGRALPHPTADRPPATATPPTPDPEADPAR